MPFREIVEPAALAMLTKVLDTYCSQTGVTEATDRQAAAFHIMHLYRNGDDTEDAILAKLLASHPGEFDR